MTRSATTAKTVTQIATSRVRSERPEFSKIDTRPYVLVHMQYKQSLCVEVFIKNIEYFNIPFFHALERLKIKFSIHVSDTFGGIRYVKAKHTLIFSFSYHRRY